MDHGCETWNYSKAIDHKVNSFKMRCYRRMLRISWTSHTRNIDVGLGGGGGLLQKMFVNETTMINNLQVALCRPHNENHIGALLYTLLRTTEERLEGKRGRGRPRRTCVDDLRDWRATMYE